MGIRSLNSLIHRYKVKLLHDLELCDSTLIIDGSELFYYLYFDCVKDNGRCGGEYSDLRRVINRFFDVLVDRCNVRCYVIMDEFKSEGNISRYLETRTSKVIGIRNVVDGDDVTDNWNSRAQPVAGKDVFKQTLRELSVPYVVVPGDGDSVVAAIANELDGYVLASDTDFCVYDLTKGFLPISDLRWENATGKCPCKVFYRQTLESAFRLPANAITFLEPILSYQDGLKNADFNPVIRAILMGASAASRNQQRRGNWRSQEQPFPLNQLLTWLGKNYRNDDSLILFLKQHVGNLPEDELRACLEKYRTLPNVAAVIDELKQGGHRLSKGKKCFHTLGTPPVLADFMPIVPDDQDRLSCNKISSSIRHAMYEINLVRYYNEEQGLDTYQVLVTDRKGDQYLAEMETVTIDRPKMEALQLDLKDEELMDRPDMNDIMEERQLYIFDVLLRGENKGLIESFDGNMKLLAAVFRYWNTPSEDQERHVEEAIKALAFTICATYYETDLPSEIEEMPHCSFDKQALHSSSQWLSCMKDAMSLNMYLGEPLECPLIGKVFSGILYQRAFAYFLGTDDLDVTSVSFFSEHVAREVFESLLLIASDTE